jgi:hypothetical protein
LKSDLRADVITFINSPASPARALEALDRQFRRVEGGDPGGTNVVANIAFLLCCR